MERKLYVGFKGKTNASSVLVNYLSESPYLLTNSFGGLKKDIEQLDNDFDAVIMFGIDKNLKDRVRIEAVAEKEGCELVSNIDLENLSHGLDAVGITNNICYRPTHYLCNEAYWFALQKFNGNAIFIHIPSIKNIDEKFLEKMKIVFTTWRG